MKKNIAIEQKLTFEEEIDIFLQSFCIKDEKSITNQMHKSLISQRFYFVDRYEQGWYVLDDTNLFHRDLTQEEAYIHLGLWERAVAWE